MVSIVIPVYNQRLDFFREALTSALQQTYANVEVVVSDNHSTNDVPAYLATLQETRLRVVKPAQFLPMVGHFQFAADQARGEWILYLCSDDWLHPHCVETLLAHLPAESADIVAVYGEIETVEFMDLSKVRFNTNRKPTGVRTARASLNELLRARPFFAWIPGGMMRRSAYERVRDVLAGHITYAFDVALLFRLHELGSLSYVDQPVAKFRAWTAQEGKLGGSRLHKNSIDLGQIGAGVEQSPILSSYLTEGTLQQWRLHQANRMWLAQLIEFFSGGSSTEECQEGIAVVNRHLHPATWFAGFISWLTTKPQALLTKPILQGLYVLFRQFQMVAKKPL